MVDGNNKITADKPATDPLIKPVSYNPPGSVSRKSRPFLNFRSALIALLLLMSAGLAWFMLTAKAVYIQTAPQTAEVEITGGFQLKLADRFLLRPGEYGLRIQAEGYYSLEQVLEVDNRQNQDHAFALERLPGHLRIETPGISGAEILIDGAVRGKTPALIRGIPPGDHQLVVRADRYLPHEETIELIGLDREQSLTIELPPAWAEVRFDSAPGGADVYVDDELLGQTPVTGELLKGNREVRIKLNGYKQWRNEIQVTAGEPQDLGRIELDPADAVVFLVSHPPRANTTVDGQYMGLTPLEVALTPGRNSTIRLFKQGYLPASRTITAESGDQSRLDIQLEPELVQVRFNITPADARLTIDGRSVEAGQRTVRLPAREHRIEVSKEGYVDYTTRLTPHSGVAQQLNIELKSLEQARLEKVKPVITTSAGQTLKLFYPGAFMKGASRREPGRRPNETLHQVVLEKPFYLGMREVSNAEYRQFDPGHSSGSVQGKSLNGERQPVAGVTWEQAARYCNWLSERDALPPFYQEQDGRITGFDPASTGYRLPTEAEWEWAARTRGDEAQLKFPWGQEMPPAENSGNYADRSAGSFLGRIIEDYSDGFEVSAPAGSFPEGNKGLYDMGGNVAEWVHDFYAIVMPGNEPPIDPMGPEEGEFHLIKGSSWAHGTITELRLSYRDYDKKQRDDVGFRIARYLE